VRTESTAGAVVGCRNVFDRFQTQTATLEAFEGSDYEMGASRLPGHRYVPRGLCPLAPVRRCADWELGASVQTPRDDDLGVAHRVTHEVLALRRERRL
jgi:hypothetical protein